MRWVVPRPWLAAVVFALLPLFFVIPAGVLIVMFELDAVSARLLSAAAVVLSLVVALVIMQRSPLSMRAFGWQRPTRVRQALWFAPLVVALLGVLFILLVDASALAPAAIGAAAVLALAVGFCEEAWYRGLVLQVLRPHGVRTAVIGSAVLFSVMHSASMLGGAPLLPTLLQLLFALVFGLVTALLVVRTGSLLVGIAWHALHNTMSFISPDQPTPTFVIGYALIGAILLAYVVWLWWQERADPSDGWQGSVEAG